MKKILFMVLAVTAFAVSGTEFEVKPQGRETLVVPTVKPGNKLIMTVQARVDSPGPGGMLDAMILLYGKKALTCDQLINRNAQIVYRGKSYDLWRRNRWMVLYAPGFDADTAGAGFKGENLFTYEFDLGVPGKSLELTIVNPWNEDAVKRFKSELKLVMKVEFREENEFPNEVMISPEEEHSWNIEYRKGEQVILRVMARQLTPRFSGFNYSAKFTVNGEPLRSRLDRATPILMERPEEFTFRDGRTMYYDRGDGSWLILFSNDYKASPARLGIKVPQPYVYVFNLTPLLKEGNNVLTVRNLWAKGHKAEKVIAVVPEFTHKPLTVQEQAAGERALPASGAAQTVSFAKDGGMELATSERVLRFRSRFSQPGGGWNRLGDSKSADPLWTVRQTVPGELVAENKFYRMTRKAELDGNRLKVRDTFKNLQDKEVAVRFANELDFAGMSLPVCRIGGQESHSLNYYPSPDNSTIFFPMRDSGIGMALEDDVSRNHAEFYYEGQERRTGFQDNFFYLEPNAEYTVEWSVYVMPGSSDYYDFINRVRGDWKANYTIDGPFYFVGLNEINSINPTQLKNIIERKGVRYVCLWEIRTAKDRVIPGVDGKGFCAYGTALFSPLIAKEREQHVKAVQAWHERFPRVKVSQYYHCFFQGFERDDDMTYQDSFITGADGKRVASSYSDGVYYKYRTVYPMPGNKFWKVHTESLDFLFDKMKVDWLYWDESNGPGTTARDRTGAATVTFNAVDGNSALIDPLNNEIIRKCAALPIIAKPALLEGIKRVAAKGGVVLFNGPATCRYRNVPGIYSMSETQDVISRAYKTHLGTPLAYGVGSPSFSAIVERLNYGVIYLREHLSYDSLALSKFFPLTIEEIHQGWIRAKERIITNRSGKFGWDGQYYARLWSFDRDGKLKDENPPIQPYTGETSVDVQPGGLTVMERVQP